MIRIGGMVPMSSLDFPGRLSAVLFLQGCPWRCGYCHNPHLLPARAPGAIGFDQVLEFLDRRRGLLDAVVFSGGEPTAQPRLHEAVAEVKRRGFLAALHTGGMYPRQLQRLLPLLDWVGLDIKAPWHRYDAITRCPGSAARVEASLQLLLGSGVRYECRTTWAPELFPPRELHTLVAQLRAAGVRNWSLQQLRHGGGAIAADSGAPAFDVPDPARLAAGFEHFQLRPALS